MVDMKDLKSFEQKRSCGFDSHLWYVGKMGNQLSWLERLICIQEVVGSTPSFSTQAGVAERGVYSLKTSRILERGCIRNGHRVGNQPYLRHLNLDLQLRRLEQRTHNAKVNGSIPFWSTKIAEVAHSVEHNLAKVGVASSSLVFRSKGLKWLKYKTEVGQSHLHTSRCRIMVITPSFQVGDVGSIPIICSR